jgi:hypothetical protein
MNAHPKWISWRTLSKDEKTDAIMKYVPNGTSASIAVSLLAENGIIDVTRSAIIGHYHRSIRKDGQWSLSTPNERGGKYVRKVEKRRAKAVTVAKMLGLPAPNFGPVDDYQSLPEPPTDKAKTLADLGPKDCRFPLWGNERPSAESLFCGCEVGTETGFYCEFHFVKCHI